MSEFESILVFIGVILFCFNGWLAAHFMMRSNPGIVGLPYAQRVKSLAGNTENPTNPVVIARDARRWLLFPLATFLAAFATALFGDFQTAVDSNRPPPDITIFVFFICNTIFALLTLLPFCRHKN